VAPRANNRWPPSVAGLLVAGVGTVIVLAAGDVIRQPDSAFGAPRWMVALFGFTFVLAGLCMLASALPTPRTRGLLGGAAALTFLTAAAIFLTWQALGGGAGGASSVAIGPIAFTLPAPVARIVDRILVWLFALLVDVLAAVAWIAVLRALVGGTARRSS